MRGGSGYKDEVVLCKKRVYEASRGGEHITFPTYAVAAVPMAGWRRSCWASRLPLSLQHASISKVAVQSGGLLGNLGGPLWLFGPFGSPCLG